jgi:Transposase DNA-binding/Transposase Tn5 dimerisation domain
MADAQAWARAQWGEAELGDQRRTERAVRLGAAMAADPAASLPAQLGGSWAELKAAYRLLDSGEAVTHARLTAPHRAAVCQDAAALAQAGEPVLFIHDTTTLSFTTHAAMAGLGPIGDGRRARGLHLHTCLAVRPPASTSEGGAGQPRQLLGLASQLLWARPAEAVESEVWMASLTAIGVSPPAGGGAPWVSVGDADSDVFAYLRQARGAGWHCLYRVCQNRRIWLAEDGGDGAARPRYLLDAMRAQPAQARRTVVVGGRGGAGPARPVELAVAWLPVILRAPRFGPERQAAPIACWAVRAWAEDPAEELEWILLTTVPVTSAAQACTRLDWYVCRWLIEEYHKGLKTGCAIEQRRLASVARLSALLGFCALIAVRLLQLREQARRTPEAPAEAAAPAELVAVLAARLGRPVDSLTQREFWHGVARLGGFLDRKSDGEPGWQTLWAGLRRLQDMAWGAATTAASSSPGQMRYG